MEPVSGNDVEPNYLRLVGNDEIAEGVLQEKTGDLEANQTDLSQTESLSPAVNTETSILHQVDTLESGDPKRISVFNRLRQWTRRNRLSLAIGASVLSIGIGMAVNPGGKTVDRAEKAALWVAPTEVCLDVGLGAGISMMVASALGGKFPNPLKAKKQLKLITQNANDSRLFKAGFAVSTISALGFGGVAAGAIMGYLPPETWGALAFPAVDLSSTVFLRHEIWKAVQKSREKTNLDQSLET